MTRRVQRLVGLTFLLGSFCLMLGFRGESGIVPGTAKSVTMQDKKANGAVPDVVIYASELPESALSEFDFWQDPASPGGKLAGTPNTGGELDPPPESDPHVKFKIKVQSGVAYRCWIHMKVGAPKGVSQANKFWVQFSDAVDKAGNPVFKPGSKSYLTAQGPTKQGWAWVSCDLEGGKSASESLVTFQISGEVTVRMQAGMEGVGFDQLVLSPAKYLDKPPSEAIVKK